jgi:ferredoxin-type protein NapH
MPAAPFRRLSQLLAAALANSYWPSLATKSIYRGPLKAVCTPILNCYACPLAVSSCPIGTIQHFLANSAHYVSLYTIGILGIVGAAVGRMACGWLCPFGFIQDLLFKIRTPKLSLPRWTTYGKYVVLALLVIVIPLLTKQPWFCKLCPAGGLEGAVPMLALDVELRRSVGAMFALKMTIVAVFLAAMVLIKRPFCRTACPLGAIFAFFNKVSIFRLSVDPEKCIKCDKCREVCPTDIKVYQEPNSPECVRCLDCISICPTKAVSCALPGLTAEHQKEATENA